MTGYSNQLHKQDRAYWDVVKGIGIIAIVLGHSASRLTAFVYLWHVPLFFFITGCLYNDAKYRSDPFGYLGRRVKSTWPKFMLYAGIHILFHNLLVRGGVYAPEDLYSRSRIVTTFLLAVPYGISETTMGPLWFVPAWVTASFLFTLCMRAGDLVDIILCGGKVTPEIISAAVALLMGALGLWLIRAGHVFPYDLQVSLLTVPLMYAAWWCGKFLSSTGQAHTVHPFPGKNAAATEDTGSPENSAVGEVTVVAEIAAGTGNAVRPDRADRSGSIGIKIRSLCGSPAFLTAFAVISGGILAALNIFGHYYMELRSGQIHGVLFYPVTLLGIGFCLSLAALICRIANGGSAAFSESGTADAGSDSVGHGAPSKTVRRAPGAGSIFRILKKVLATLGSCSFDIMALHVLIFKLMDVAWVHVLHAGVTGAAGTADIVGAAGDAVASAAALLPNYPCSFPGELGIIYRICGLLIPTALCLIVRKIKVLHR